MGHPDRSQANASTHLWGIFGFDNCGGNAGGTYVWACFSMLCWAVGFPASVLILYRMFKTYRAAAAVTPSDFLMINLSVMDAVFLLVIPPAIMNHFLWKITKFETFVNAVYALNTCGRPLLMACTCLDCYVAVVHPIVYHQRRGLLPRVLMAAVVWTLTLVTGLVYSLSYQFFFNEYSSVFFIVAIVVIAICDGFIIRSLLQSDLGGRKVHVQKQRAIHVLVYSLVMAVISYLPPILLFNIGRHVTSNFTDFVCIIGYPVVNTATVGSAVMPMLFLYNTGKLNCFRFTCCKW